MCLFGSKSDYRATKIGQLDLDSHWCNFLTVLAKRTLLCSTALHVLFLVRLLRFKYNDRESAQTIANHGGLRDSLPLRVRTPTSLAALLHPPDFPASRGSTAASLSIAVCGKT